MTYATWAFGWEALVAIGTLLLACVTAGLAWLTRTLAKSSAADVRSQWRPVILPGTKLAYDPDGKLLVVAIRNSGRGPALFVRTTLDPTGNSPDNWNLGALAPGDEVTLMFSGSELRGALYQVLLDYNDLAGRLYSSALVLDLQTGPRFYDVKLFEDIRVTHHGDAVFPQPGLTSVGPKPRRPLRAKLRSAWTSFRER